MQKILAFAKACLPVVVGMVTVASPLFLELRAEHAKVEQHASLSKMVT